MPEESKAIVRRFVNEVINRKKLAVFDELVAANVVAHHVPPGAAPDYQRWKDTISVFLTAFPDIQISIEDTVAEADRVVIRWTVRGTHQGELTGIPATGKEVTFTGMLIYRVADGKIIERWEEMDMMSLMRQLGIIPSAGQDG